MIEVIKNKFTITILLIFVSFALTSYTKGNPAVSQNAKSFFLGLSSPLVYSLGTVERKISDFFTNYFFLLNLQEQNKNYQKQISRLIAENTKLQEVGYQNERLQKILKFTSNTSYAGKVVRVLAYTNPNNSRAVVIDHGTKQGVSINSAVVNGQALVGLVTTVSANTAVVTLISDQALAVDAMIQNGRIRGLIIGHNKHLDWTYLSAKQKIYVGNRVITSGFDELYPPGLVIGNIISVDEENKMLPIIKVKPLVDLDKLETLLVIDSVKGSEG